METKGWEMDVHIRFNNQKDRLFLKIKEVIRLAEEKKSNHSPGKHFLLMVLCCAIPIIGIVVLSSMGILGSWGYYLLILLCPLLHFLFMRKMGSRH